MKKKLFIVVLFFTTFVATYAQEVKMNDEGALELKEVVEVSKMSKDAIFISVQSMLSDWTYNSNSQNKVDYSDKESGVVIAKGRLFMGYKKVGLLFGWNVFADYSCTIKAKDGKYQVILKVPTMYFKFENPKEDAEETAPMAKLYPEYQYKSSYTIKKPAKELAPQVPDMMKSMFAAIRDKIKNASADDDF